MTDSVAASNVISTALIAVRHEVAEASLSDYPEVGGLAADHILAALSRAGFTVTFTPALSALTDALEWYAQPVFPYAITQANEPRSAVHGDGGQRARTALIVFRGDPEAIEWQYPRCSSSRWVAASLNGGYTTIRQCVPCGYYTNDPVVPRGDPDE